MRVPFKGVNCVSDGDSSVPSNEVNCIGYGVTVILIVEFVLVSNPIHQLISVPSDGVSCVSFGDPSVPSDGVNCMVTVILIVWFRLVEFWCSTRSTS